MKAHLLVVAFAAVATSAGAAGTAHAARGATDESANAAGDSAWVNVQYGDRREHHDGRRGGPDAVLFTNPDFHGDRFVVDGDYLPDLANSGFNDRAQSLRIEHGYWIFCSDAQFRGQCRTFGPGSYARLGWALDNKVSSGRRISNRYPYKGQPSWGELR